MSRNKFLLIVLLIGVAIGVFISLRRAPTSSVIPKQAGVNQELPTSTTSKDVEVIAENLKIPWEIVFLPNNEILVTERPGNLILIKNKQKIPVNGVAHVGEGGLLGMALHPKFSKNHWLYLYLTSGVNGRLSNRVERYRLENNQLVDRKIILEGIIGAPNHDGGRIAFGPDYYLYITTGDAGNSSLAQDTNSLNGKILRIGDDGSIPGDNPFGNAVYSYGHRNPQGLAWDSSDRLWATEHGRSGIQSGLDELNLIEKGKNYGWPIIQGDETRRGMLTPVINSGPNATWAPAGLAYFFNGKLFFTGLRGETLYEFDLEARQLKEHFKGQFGRLRAVIVGPDGYIYVTTSNTDGRGTVQAGDDKLIKINPRFLFK